MEKTAGKICVNVVMGGPSAEHEISLQSGREVVLNLDRGKYTVRAVVITESRTFFFRDANDSCPELEQLRSPGPSAGFEGPLDAAKSERIWDDCDVAFLALHGAFGEDGRFQGYLETLGVPYTGSGVYASAVGMNKVTTKALFECNGLSTPPSSVLPSNVPVDFDALAARHGFPCFVKCPQSGSSRLMGRAEDPGSLRKLVSELSGETDVLLVESTIEGTEFSCPVLERPDGSLETLPPVEIRPKSSTFFDYEAKYSPGASDEIVPIPHSPDIVARIQEIALKAHQLVGCSGFSRTDMILRDGTFYVLEINTIPGITPNSLTPKAFAATGNTYPELLDILIQTALARV